MSCLRTLAAVLALAQPGIALAGVDTVPEAVRRVVPLAEGWRFQYGEATGVEAVGFDDAAWSRVAVPHTWNRVGFYIPNPEAHIHTRDNTNKEQGVGWYRLTFTPEAIETDQKAWLQFDAASRTAEVWLNGVKLGEHQGGFSRFRFDATAMLKPGQPNLLVVKTDNTNPTGDASTADILPLRGDFFIHGGLYRPVSLIVTDDVHVDLLDFGGSGVYATTTSIEDGQARIAVRARIRNDSGRRQAVVVATQLLDVEGKVAAESSRNVALAPAAGDEEEASLILANPHLWQGVDDPYLYTLRVEVRGEDGAVFDRVDQAYGVRQIRIDPDRGLVLNGKPLRLVGTGYHQDREGRGWAVMPQEVEEDVQLLRDMGANSIRLTHYQHGQTVHDLADRYGLIVWDEIPLVSVWVHGEEMEAREGLRANARQQLQEMVRQGFNHPSIAVWGIANEVDFGNSFPNFITGDTRREAADPMPLLRELDALARTEDPSRPTTLATCCEGRAFASNVEVPTTAEATETAGANRYFGWYYGKADGLGDHLDMLHARRPRQPLAVTEYGAGGATTMHTDDPRGGPADSRGREQPEEYMSYVHEENWADIAERPYLWASWLWNGFDFATTVRREGDADDINTKGLITYDRKIKKDPYYFYRANWSHNPTVHVASSRYVDRNYQFADVRVYSNAPSTRLIHNGVEVGEAQRDCPQKACSWRIRLAVGTNEISAVGAFADQEVRDSVQWSLREDAPQVIRIDSGALMPAASPRGRFGSDAFFVGGRAANVDIPPPAYQLPVTRREVSGGDGALLRTFRSGEFSYRIPVEPGRYRVTLSFVEPEAEVGARRFDVSANGRAVLPDFDVRQAAGAVLMPVERAFTVDARSGEVLLEFKGRKGEPLVSAVELTRQ